ncbi:MAG: Ig-like domain-containing protein, partial [Anaerolineales bacterium]|nr:Ig-like domain-containing protein [Anaerolineales bacterium]
MQTLSTIKTKFSTLILLAGLVCGSLLSLLLWLDISSLLYRALAWISFGALALLSLAFLRCAARRSFILLAALASAAIIYLFPQLFGPACNGMPIAFAGKPGCEKICEEDCQGWDAEGQCSWSKKTCWWECPPEDQPPTISASLVCSQWGQSNWCVGNETLSLTASDPQGATLQISINIAGDDTTCPNGTSCSIPLPNGSGTINYLVQSMTTLTASGSTSWKRDTISPQINGSLSGTKGSNDWYVSNPVISASATDSISGLAVLDYSLDNAGYIVYSGPITLPDGAHTMTLRARDRAGNQNTTTQLINVDTTTPLIDLSVNGTPGANDWYVSDILVSGAGSDSTSGLASFEYAVDGGAWTPYTDPLPYSEGQRAVQFRAADQAGNTIVTPMQTYMVDTSTPSLNLALSGTPGTNGWYTSNVQAVPSASDSVSGLALLEYALDGGEWTTYTNTLTFTDGIHTLGLRAFDAAGNLNQQEQKIYVDTITPQIKLPVDGTPGAGGWYISNIQVNASSSDGGSGISAFEYSLDDGAWTSYINLLPYAEGQYRLAFRAIDMAGNVTITPAQNLWVDTTPPEIQMPDTLKPGRTEYYKVLDAGSEVGGTRVVIQDGQERYPKVAWGDGELKAVFTGEIFWDGRFADGIVAPAGDYYVTVKAHDQAGNESEATSVITVANSLLTYLIPPYTPPSVTAPDVPAIPPVLPSPEATFGGETVIEPIVPQSSTLSTESQPANLPASNPSTTNLPTSTIVWGSIAAAALGAVAAEAVQKKSFGGEAVSALSRRTEPVEVAVEASTVEFTAEPITNVSTANLPTTP